MNKTVIVLYMKAEMGAAGSKENSSSKQVFVSGDCSQNLSFGPLVAKKEESERRGRPNAQYPKEGVSEEHKVFIRQIADRV